MELSQGDLDYSDYSTCFFVHIVEHLRPARDVDVDVRKGLCRDGKWNGFIELC